MGGSEGASELFGAGWGSLRGRWARCEEDEGGWQGLRGHWCLFEGVGGDLRGPWGLCEKAEGVGVV